MLLKKQQGKRDVVTIKVYLKEVLLGKETITNSKLIAENFNKFFTEIGPRLAGEIEKPAKTFDVYLKKVDVLQPEYPLSINELKEAFFSLQANKSSSHDEISFNFIKSRFRSLNKPLLNIFRLSLEEKNFPYDLKRAKITNILRLAMKMILVTIPQSLFDLVFSKYLRKSCIKDFSIIYQSTIYLIKNNLVFGKVTHRNML